MERTKHRQNGTVVRIKQTSTATMMTNTAIAVTTAKPIACTTSNMYNKHKFCLGFVPQESTPERLVIRDLDLPSCRTITNDAEAVIEYLHFIGELPEGRRCFYYDTCNNLDELLHDGKGKFLGFFPGPGPGREFE